MARLPIPGSDDNQWGIILNDFLRQAHNDDGTLKASGAAADATSSTKGIVRLTGDLGGTADSPTVPGLTTKADAARLVSAGTGLTGGGSLSADRTLSVDFGPGATQAATGNHTHPAARHTQSWAHAGTAQILTGTGRWYNRTGISLTIIGVWATADTPPTGSSIIVDVHRNGTTIFTTQGNRPAIPASSNGGTLATPAVTTLADGEYLTVDIDQVGSTIAGADLTVGIVYS